MEHLHKQLPAEHVIFWSACFGGCETVPAKDQGSVRNVEWAPRDCQQADRARCSRLDNSWVPNLASRGAYIHFTFWQVFNDVNKVAPITGWPADKTSPFTGTFADIETALGVYLQLPATVYSAHLSGTGNKYFFINAFSGPYLLYLLQYVYTANGLDSASGQMILQGEVAGKSVDWAAGAVAQYFKSA